MCGVEYTRGVTGSTRRASDTGDRAAVTAVGIDIGTTNTKVARIAVRGGTVDVLGVARAATPEPAHLAAAIRRLLATVPGAAAAPMAVGIASMAETGVPLDDTDTPIGPWLRWDADQGDAEARALASRLGARELFAATGVRVASKVPLARWAWLGAHQPERFARMRRWAGAADLLCLAMTGRLATDHTLAGRTLAYRLPPWPARLPDGFDAALLAEVRLRPEQMPDVLGSGQLAGVVTGTGFADVGLRPGTAVAVAGHDHAVGAYGAGVRASGSVADSIGTAEAVYRVTAREPIRARVAEAGMSLVRTVAGNPAILAGSTSAGAMVSWWLTHAMPSSTAAEVFALAARWQRARPEDLPLVLPYVNGRQTPAPDPAARVRLVDVAETDPPGRRAAALVNGLALHAQWMLDVQARLDGAAPDGIAVLGGPAAANGAWMAAKARYSPDPMRLVRHAEPVAVGAALLALGRAGVLADPPAMPADALLDTVAGTSACPGASGPASTARSAAALDRFMHAATDHE